MFIEVYDVFAIAVFVDVAFSCELWFLFFVILFLFWILCECEVWWRCSGVTVEGICERRGSCLPLMFRKASFSYLFFQRLCKIARKLDRITRKLEGIHNCKIRECANWRRKFCCAILRAGDSCVGK